MEKSGNYFHLINHTADAAFDIRADSLENLFTEAAKSMYSLLFEELPASSSQKTDLALSAYSVEELLVSFLNELLYLISVKKRILYPIILLKIDSTEKSIRLNCRAGSHKISARKLARLTEIKAVTYHQLNIKRTDKGFYTRLVFDL